MPILIALLLTFLTLRFHLPPSSSVPKQLPSKFITVSPPPAPSPRPKIVTPKDPDSTPWGVIQKVGDHTYRIRVQNDPVMGTPEEILSALNTLRSRHNAQPLKTDPRLCDYAKSRAQHQNQLGQTDGHAGFIDFLENQDGFKKLGFARVGENSSYGYILSGVHLIEFVYMQSPEHNANQLDPAWDHACAGVAGLTTNLLFATAPL